MSKVYTNEAGIGYYAMVCPLVRELVDYLLVQADKPRYYY